MAEVTEYEKGLIRTDKGSFIDKGNWGVDPCHPDLRGGRDIRDGGADARQAFANADLFAQQYGLCIRPTPGTYRFDSNLTITSPVEVVAGVVFKPASGVTLTLPATFIAPFFTFTDTSLGGTVTYTSYLGGHDLSTNRVDGKPGPSEVLFDYVAVREYTLPANFAGSYFEADAAATAEAEFSVTKDDVEIGTITVAAAGTTATFVSAGSTVAAGERVKIIAPSVQDATLADFTLTIKGDLT